MNILSAALLVIAVVVFVAFVTALPVMWIVNYLFTPTLLTSVFGTSQIGFWQAFWLAFLCGCLFKSSNSCTSK